MTHRLLNEDVSEDDLKLFDVYARKNESVGLNLHSWLSIGLATNAGLLASVAFILGPPGNSNIGWPLCSFQAWAILFLAIGGVVYCGRWSDGHRDMSDWQTRTNAILGQCEKQLLKPEFLSDWRKLAEMKTYDESLERPAMWQMINVYHQPRLDRPKIDVVDRMAIPQIVIWFWWAVIGTAGLSLLCTLVQLLRAR